MKTSSFVIAACILTSIFSCKKDSTVQCEGLKEAAFLNRVESVKTLINSHIQNLPSKTYNQQNIESLTQKISACDISSSLRCFDCIQTLPSQTEIWFNFYYNGTQVKKAIDLSYSMDQKIVFLNLHDQ